MRSLALFPILFLLAGGCSEDANRLVVDLSQKSDAPQAAKGQTGAVLNVAVASMISPKETFVSYQALLGYLSEKVDLRINLVQRQTYAEVNNLLGSGAIDLAFICSGPYVSGKDRCHFEALVVPEVRRKSMYRAYLITGRSGPVQRFEDLRGRVFAFSDPDSNAGFTVPRFLLAQSGEDPRSFFGKTIFTHSHDNSILAVSKSLVDGAFVHEHIWDYYLRRNSEISAKTRVIYESEPFGNPPLVASALMPQPLKDRVRDLLLSMHLEPRGAGILGELGIDRFMLPEDRLYEPIRRMHAQLSLLEDGHDTRLQP